MNTAGGLPTSVSDPPLSTPLLSPALGCPSSGGPPSPSGLLKILGQEMGVPAVPFSVRDLPGLGQFPNVLLHYLGSSCGLWWDLLPQRLVPQLGQLMQQLFDSCCYNWGPGLFDPSTYWL